MKYIDGNKNQVGTTIVNLFIVTGDEHQVAINRDLSLERLFGFEPKIDDEEDKNQILFFVQYYDKAKPNYYIICAIKRKIRKILY